MLKQNFKMTSLILIILLTFVNVTTGFAQVLVSDPQSAKKVLVDEEFLKAAELAIAERNKYKVQVEGLNEVVIAKDKQLAALRGLLQLQLQISEDWKTSAESRKDAITKYDLQVDKLNQRVAKAESAKLKWGFIGLVGGIAITLFSQRK